MVEAKAFVASWSVSCVHRPSLLASSLVGARGTGGSPLGSPKVAASDGFRESIPVVVSQRIAPVVR